jgi:hypothetical protein
MQVRSTVPIRLEGLDFQLELTGLVLGDHQSKCPDLSRIQQ